MYITKASWEMIGRCNAKCIHCYAEGIRDVPELSEEKVVKLLDNLSCGGVEELSLTGGEPSLSKNFQLAIEYAHSLGMSINVISNGFSLKPQHYKLFNTGLAFASLSFHAGSEDSFKMFYGVNKRKYYRFLKTIDSIKKFSVSTCIMEENKQVLESILKVVTERKEKVTQWAVYNLRKCGKGFKATELSKLEKDKIGKWLSYECLSREINFISGLEDQDKDNCPLTFKQSSIFITPNGYIRPCYALLRFNTEKNLVEYPLDELLNDESVTRWYAPKYNFDNRCKAELLEEGYSLDYVTKSGGKEAFLNATLSFPSLKIRIFGETCRLYNPLTQKAFMIPLEQKSLLDFDGKSIKEYLKFLGLQGYETNNKTIAQLFDFIHTLKNAKMVNLTGGGIKNEKLRNES